LEGGCPTGGSAAAVPAADPDGDADEADQDDDAAQDPDVLRVLLLRGDVAGEGLCTDGETRHARVPSVRSCRVGCYLPLPVVPASAACEPQNADDRQGQENPGYPVGSVQRDRSGACERLVRLRDDHALPLWPEHYDGQDDDAAQDQLAVAQAEVLVAGRVRHELEGRLRDVHDDPLSPCSGGP